ncbi:MAG: hypothetical protein ACKERG_04665 [Candidatus Hodgkinia cicadicola]
MCLKRYAAECRSNGRPGAAKSRDSITYENGLKRQHDWCGVSGARSLDLSFCKRRRSSSQNVGGQNKCALERPSASGVGEVGRKSEWRVWGVWMCVKPSSFDSRLVERKSEISRPAAAYTS